MMQVAIPPPTPPPGVDPTFLLFQVLDYVGPLAVLIVVAVGLRVVFKTPVGEAIAERIRNARRWRHGEIPGETNEHVAALEAQVASLRGEVSELAERLDFAERILAERR